MEELGGRLFLGVGLHSSVHTTMDIVVGQGFLQTLLLKSRLLERLVHRRRQCQTNPGSPVSIDLAFRFTPGQTHVEATSRITPALFSVFLHYGLDLWTSNPDTLDAPPFARCFGRISSSRFAIQSIAGNPSRQ